MEQKYFYIKMSWIKEPAQPVRSFVDEDKFNELVESIKENGIIEPIICNDRNDHLEIIAGHRRFMAAKIAGLESVPVIVKKVSEEKIDKIKLHENYGREEVSPVDEANFLNEYMRNKNMGITEMAEQIGKSRNYIERRLSILSFPNILLEAVKNNAISFSSAHELNKIDNEQELERAINYARVNGCSHRTAQLWVQQWEVAKQSIDLTQTAPSTTDQPEVAGKIIWTCFVCDAPKNATETYTVPLCPECRKNILEGKEGIKNEG